MRRLLIALALMFAASPLLSGAALADDKPLNDLVADYEAYALGQDPIQAGRLALLKPFTPRSCAPVRFVFERLAFVRSASISIASRRSAPVRSAPASTDPLKSARTSFVPIIRVPVKSEKLRSELEKSEPVISAESTFAFTMFVRIRPIDWFFMSGAAFICTSFARDRSTRRRSPIRRAPVSRAVSTAPANCTENNVARVSDASERFALSRKLTVRLQPSS